MIKKIAHQFCRIKYLICGYLLVGFGIAQAQPINLLGINLLMDTDAQMKALENRGYQCQTQPGIIKPGPDFMRCTKDIPPNKGKAFVGGYPYRMEFSCENFNICHLDSKGQAQSIVNAKIVPRLDYSIQFGFCGVGKSGDQICLKDSFIILSKHNLGSVPAAPPSFK